MAITTRDGLIAATAAGQQIRHFRNAARTSVATVPFSLMGLSGSPGAGVLAGTNTANGLVPTDATAGCPPIDAFTGANTGYISGFEAGCPVACKLTLYDMVFKAGAYSFNANTTLTSQPSWSSRAPGGSYHGFEIWLEAVTAFTGAQTIQITYQDQDDNAGDTGTVATGATPIVGRMFRVPFASGDTGCRRINSVVSTVSSAGTFNVLVLRKLAAARIGIANDYRTQGFDLTKLIQVHDNAALFVVSTMDSTSTSTPDLSITIING